MDRSGGARGVRWARAFSGAVLYYVYRQVCDDLALIAAHARLFFGVVCTGVGLLSFAADRYCDGSTSAYATCTRSAVYYFYPWWAVGLVLVGLSSMLLWYVRRNKKREVH